MPFTYGRRKNSVVQLFVCKKNERKFILRIEDTDQSRYVNGAEKYIESLDGAD